MVSCFVAAGAVLSSDGVVAAGLDFEQPDASAITVTRIERVFMIAPFAKA